MKHFIPLQSFFRVQDQFYSVTGGKLICQELENPYTKLYLEFLSYILPSFISINKEMQSKDIKVHVIYKRVASFYKTILENYMNLQYVRNNDVLILEYDSKDNFLPLEKIYLGGKVSAYLVTNSCALNADDLKIFHENCRNFYIESARQVLLRFPFKALVVLKYLEIIEPSKLVKKQSIIPLALHFPHIIDENNFNNIDLEFRFLRNLNIGSGDLSISDFWKEAFQLKKGDGSKMFPLLEKLVYFIFCLPHSSATVERIFSSINLNKTKLRNRLKTETLSGILHAKANFKNKNCYELEIDEAHLTLFKKSMYEF